DGLVHQHRPRPDRGREGDDPRPAGRLDRRRLAGRGRAGAAAAGQPAAANGQCRAEPAQRLRLRALRPRPQTACGPRTAAAADRPLADELREPDGAGQEHPAPLAALLHGTRAEFLTPNRFRGAQGPRSDTPGGYTIGATLMAASMLCFAGMDTITKFVVRDHGVAQVLFVRSVVFTAFAALLA